MHWIWLWATFKKNNQTTINAPTNTPFVQKYANYNSTGNRTTTSSHLNSGLRIWTKKMKWIQESLTKLLAAYIPKKSEHRFAEFYFRAIVFYFKLFMCSRWGHSYTSSAFAITCILTFISYDATRFDLANIVFKFLLFFQTRIHFATRIFSWRVMENIRGDQKLQEWEVLWATILFISLLNDIVNIGFMIRNHNY